MYEIFHRRKQSPYGFFSILLSQDQVRIEGRRRQPALPVATVLWQILAYSVLSDFTSNTEKVKKGKHIIVQLFAPTPHKSSPTRRVHNIYQRYLCMSSPIRELRDSCVGVRIDGRIQPGERK